DRAIAPRIAALEAGRRRGFAVLVAVTALMFLPVRGSLTVAPMNTGFVYFHKTKSYANHSAINVIWNFLYNLNKSTRLQYPEDLIPKQVAEHYFREFYPPDDSVATRIWNVERPNIILFILESFTAD